MGFVKSLYKLEEVILRSGDTRFVKGLGEVVKIHIDTDLDLEVVLKVACGLQVIEYGIVKVAGGALAATNASGNIVVGKLTST